MKLVWKLTVALMAGMVLVLAWNAYFRIRRETALLHDDRVHDHALVGRALAAAVAAVWRSDGKADALRVVEGANEHEGVVRIRWIDLHAARDEIHANLADLESLATGDTITQIAPTKEGDERFSYTSVAVSGERVGYIELFETLDAERRAARTIVVDTVTMTLTMLVVCGVLSAALGLWLVGRPVQALVAKARRIGAGDFSTPLVLKARDELSSLSLEMNATCARLELATQTAQRASAARIATLEQLRHADRLTTVGKLASGVAHELGTPLNVVSARAKMMAAGETTPEETVDYARVIAGAADRMTKIIRQLLTFARRRPTRKAPCDLQKVARETAELLTPLATKVAVRFHIAEPSAPVIANVDGDAIQQVLTNLFVNAIHAMPKGGTADVSFHFETRSDELGDRHYEVLRVQDQGDGIDAKALPHIFEPFFTTKEVGQGTGLGLSVTHGIIEDHGGFIEVTSEVGKGCIFAVYLPAEETR